MSRLRPEKLHVTFAPGTEPEALRTPRRYTLTHSDMTGDLYLTIGADYDRAKISGLLAHLMRDEVLAEWREGKDGHTLHVFCYVSGGLVLGTAGWRDGIFRHELPLVLEAFRYGDRALFRAHPALDTAPIHVHFQSSRQRYRRIEDWGTPADYRLPPSATEAA